MSFCERSPVCERSVRLNICWSVTILQTIFSLTLLAQVQQRRMEKASIDLLEYFQVDDEIQYRAQSSGGVEAKVTWLT